MVQPLSFKFDSGRTFIQSTEPPVVFERSLTEDLSGYTKKYQYVNSMMLFLTNYEFSLSRVKEYGCYCLPNAFFENDIENGVDKVFSTPANGHPLDHLDKSFHPKHIEQWHVDLQRAIQRVQNQTPCLHL